MSYILDALKKAAEQRSGPSLEVRRLLMPAPVPAVSRARYVKIAAIAGGVVAVGAVLWMWMPASDVSAPETPPVASVAPAPPPAPTATPPPATAAPPAATAAPPAPTATPPAHTVAPSAPTTTAHATLPDDRPRIAAEKKPRVPLVPAESRTDPARTTSTDTRTPATNVRPVEAKPTRPASPAAPGPIVSLLPPAGAPTAATRTDTGKLKVEVIVYSDERPLRWAFISGRRYVEGDAIGDGARVEEIQSNGVVIVEDGRRITLRP